LPKHQFERLCTHRLNLFSLIGVAPVTQVRVATQLNAFLPVDTLTEKQLEIKAIQDKWDEIKFLSRDEAQKTLEGDWLEAYNRYFEKYDDDMVRMLEIAENVMGEPVQVQKKTKGQRKRDSYAKVVALKEARAARAAPAAPKV
jgi:hypothetical protein